MNKALMTPEDFADLYRRRPRCQRNNGVKLPVSTKPHIVKDLRGKYTVRWYLGQGLGSGPLVGQAKSFVARLNQGA